jgi:hypothetical protein
MKIEFTIDAATETRLRALMASLEIPLTALVGMAREHLQSLNENDESFIAEGFVYPNRASARRAAGRLLSKYPGNQKVRLRYRSTGHVCRADFPPSRRLRTQVPNPPDQKSTAFSTALSSEHMSRVRELVALLDIPEAAIEANFRATLESDVWRNDWTQWTIDFVYPNRKAAARVAKRIAQRFPNDRTEIRLNFLKNGERVCEQFV